MKMKHFAILTITSFVFIVATFFIYFSIDSQSSENNNWFAEEEFEKEFEENDLFAKLNRVHDPLYFPYSPEMLEHCQEINDQHCLGAYQEALEGKKRLLKDGPKLAFYRTLRAIKANCAKEGAENHSDCQGAVVALYFFSSEEEDKKILAFFQQSELKLVRRVFQIGWAEWLNNRPDNERWWSYLDKLKGISSYERKLFKASFEIGPPHYSSMKMLQ